MRELKLEMLPISLHHDGFSVIAKEGLIESDLNLLAQVASDLLKRLGLRPVVLELSQYRQDNLAPLDRIPEWVQKVIVEEEINKEFLETIKARM